MCRNQLCGAAAGIRRPGLSCISRVFFLFGLLIFYSTGASAQTIFTPAAVGEQSFYTDRDIPPLTLPAASGGSGDPQDYTYALEVSTPVGRTLSGIGLRFDLASGTLQGRPTSTGNFGLRYTVTDTAGTPATLDFTLTVATPLNLGAAQSEYTFTTVRDIGSLTLPEASGGFGGLTYSLTVPGSLAGLQFDASQRILSGAPERIAQPVNLTFAVSDSTGLQNQIRLLLRVRVDGICERTTQVREVLISKLLDDKGITVSDCGEVTAAQLGSLDEDLELSYQGLIELRSGDFYGLPALGSITLDTNALTDLPDDIFDGLGNLLALDLGSNQLTTLPEGIFDDLVKLKFLRIPSNDLQSLPANLFNNLGALKEIGLGWNDLTQLPTGLFDSLFFLEQLHLRANQLTALPANIFDDLVRMQELRLEENRLVSLPTGLLDSANSLIILGLGSNRLTSLPAGLFEHTPILWGITLGGTEQTLDTLPIGLFNPLRNNLSRLNIYQTVRFPLPAPGMITQVYVMGDPTRTVHRGRRQVISVHQDPVLTPFAVSARYVAVGDIDQNDFLSSSEDPTCADIAGYAVIPAGASSVDLTFCPIPDARGAETETYTLSLRGNPAAANNEGFAFSSTLQSTLATIRVDGARNNGGITIILGASPSNSTVAVSGSPAVADDVATITFTVNVLDDKDTPISDEVVTFPPTTHVNFSANTCTTDTNGQCSITATSTRAGAYSIEPSVTNGTFSSAEYTFVAGDFDAGQSSVEVSGSPSVADDFTPVTITAIILDAYGNPISGATVSFADTTNVRFSTNTCTTGANGRCSIRATSTGATSYTTMARVASDPIGTAVYSFIVSTISRARSRIEVFGSPATANGLAEVTIAVTVMDANANPIDGAAVRFADTAEVSFSASTCTTDSTTGQCSITATSTMADTYNTGVTANTVALNVAEYVFVADTGVAINSEVAVSGSPAVADGADAVTITATVKDGNNNLVSGETVFFNSTPRVSFSADTCDTSANGRCSITATALIAGLYNTAVRIANGTFGIAEYTFVDSASRDPDGAFATLNDAMLPDIAKSIADQNAGLIIRRIQDAFTARLADTRSAGFNLDGQRTLDGILAVQLADAENNEDKVNWKRVLANSSFVLPLGTLGSVREPTFPVPAQVDRSDRGGAITPHPLPEITDFTGAIDSLSTAANQVIADVLSTDLSELVVWGAGAYRNFGGEPGNNDAGIDWDGDLLSLHFGADTLLNPNTLVGLAVSWNESDIDYTRDYYDSENPGGEGAHILDMITLSPYIAWTSHSGKLHLWGTVGLGSGRLDIYENNMINSSSDASQQSIALGTSGEFLKTNKGTAYRLRSEYLYTTLDIAGGGVIDEREVAARRFRLAVEAARSRDLGNGIRYEPRLELGIRHDAGAGDNGDVMELRARWYRNNVTSGWRADGSAYFLFGRDEYHEWGIEGSLRLATPSVYGLRVSLAPSYGAVSKDARQLWDGRLWEQELPDVADQDQDLDYEPTMQARVSYDMPALAGYGMMTPFGEATLGQGKRSFRFGVEWKLDALVDMELAGERDIDDRAETENTILLKGMLRF